MTPHLPTNRLTRHLLFWAGVTVLAGLAHILQDISNSCYFCHWVPIVIDLFFSMLPTFVVCTYLWAYLVLPLLFRRHFAGFLAGALLLNLAEWFLNDLLTYSLKFPLKHWLHQEMPFEQDTWLFGSLFPGRTFWIRNLIAGLFIGVKLFRQWQRKQAESQRLEHEKLKTELQLIKLQLNPGFLFASLSRLHQLTQQHPKQAPEVVLKLAHLLRLYSTKARPDRVPLARETEVIEQYVFLQRVMHPSGLEVSLTIRGNPDNQTIVPLLLFSIVENAFRHLPAERMNEPTWVSIDLSMTDTQVTFKVINELTYPPDYETGKPTNLYGLEKQLAFYYPDNHSLNVWQEDQINVVTLTISFPTIA